MLLVKVFLWLSLACAFSFIALLFRYDFTARVLVFKILSRIGIRIQRFCPPEVSLAYQRLKSSERVSHRPLLLNLATSDGSGQVTHPDVAYLSEGFGAKKWTYWMACTPYPHRDARFENPEIFVSYDGLDWIAPSPRTNPLVPAPPKRGDHHSDPDILFYGGELWLFYRQTLRSTTPTQNKIFVLRSGDGTSWSSPVQVLSDDTGREVLSPAVIHDGRQFVMWTVEICDEQFLIVRRTSPNGLEWTAPSKCLLAGLQEPRHAWHIDVTQESDRLSAVLISCMGKGGAKSRIHYAHSEDQGLSWSTNGFWFEQAYQFEAAVQYRGSLLKRTDNSHEYDLWYSAACARNLFSIAYVRVKRDCGATEN